MAICKESRAYYRKKLGDTAQCSFPLPPDLQGWSEKILAERGRLALFEYLGWEWFFSGEGAEDFLKVFLIK